MLRQKGSFFNFQRKRTNIYKRGQAYRHALHAESAAEYMAATAFYQQPLDLNDHHFPMDGVSAYMPTYASPPKKLPY